MLSRFIFLCLLASATPIFAQQPYAPGTPEPVSEMARLELPATFESAPPPELPASVSRDTEGRTTVRAIRLLAPLRVDGNLDEDIYRTVTPISDYIQAEPQPGAPATEKTEAWISFDEENIYVSVRASESQPERMIVNEMRRDSSSVWQNENFQFSFDTFYDRRNSVMFQFNPIGGRMDGQVTNESSLNTDWNPIWRLSVHRVEGGWTAEAAVPFKSLRFKPGQTQIWGFQARRINRWKNETSYLTNLPPGSSLNGYTRVSRYATMVGLEVPSGSRALDLKPYVTSNSTTDLTATPAVRNRIGKDFGFDAKYGVTQNLTADFTYNTDFAQVEADEQQVNLTRFNLFFPEKREFFLENQGLFNFAVSGGGNFNNLQNDTPSLFYSRSIGLDGGRQVPLDVGGRMSGRVGAYSVGLMNIQSGEVNALGIPSANFGVARIKRDILRRSSVGLLYTRRAPQGQGAGETYGVDGSLAFFQNLYINTYWARAHTPGVNTDDTSYRGQLNYNGDRYAMQIERLAVGDNFTPQMGFVRRDNFTKDRVFLRFSPRPKRMKAVRKFTYLVSANYFENGAGQKESLERNFEFSAEFQTSDKIQFQWEPNFELLTAPFEIAKGVTIPQGGYDIGTFTAQLQIGQQRMASGTWSLETGSFYGGTRTALAYTTGRVKMGQHLAVEPGLSINRVALPWGDFTAQLISARTTYAVTPLMFVSSLMQYNSSNNSLSTNVRLRWEYQPGSELFVVYDDSRDTLRPGLPGLQNRAIVFKINRLFRF
ncbi:MAG: DUF5916 domain-containing protein [Vicinamibacterales bacterium]